MRAGLGEYAWYRANSGSKTHPVGEKKPNAWGLYDMHGNVWEWCADWYRSGYYAESPADDPRVLQRARTACFAAAAGRRGEDMPVASRYCPASWYGFSAWACAFSRP